MYWYKKVVLENYANFNGRARRSEYWYFVLFNFLFSLVARFLDSLINFQNLEIIGTIYSLAVFIPSLAVSVRRLHDIGKSGWIFLIVNVVLVILAMFLVLGSFMHTFNSSALQIISGVLMLGVVIWFLIMLCKEGDDFTNKYGPDPKANDEEIEQIGIE